MTREGIEDVGDADDIDVAAVLEAVEEAQPLVTALTNDVTVNEVANTALHWGGLPVMSGDRREVREMVEISGALLLNMGTVNEAGEKRMIQAGRAANRADVPVVFDPVGVGATSTRGKVADRILEEVDVTVVKGNRGEISALTGEDAEVKGVESVGEYGDIATTAMASAGASGAVVVASGEVDVVAGPNGAYEIDVGHELMGRFVGSGCMLGMTVAAFAGGVGLDRSFSAALAGTIAFGVVGERTADGGDWQGPASYQTAFLDEVAGTDPADFADFPVDDRVSTAARR